MTPELSLLTGAVYLLLGRWLARSQGRLRDPVFAIANIAVVYLFFFWEKGFRFSWLVSVSFGLYLVVVCAQYSALRLWAARSGSLPWLAFLAPIAALAVVRYAPVEWIAGAFGSRFCLVVQRHPEIVPSSVFVGISYLAFRSSHLVLEVRNGVVPVPSVWQYLGFAFFAPTMAVGPISPYSLHRQAFVSAGCSGLPVRQAALRVLVGAVKFRFFGPLLNQLTYSGLVLDGHPHHWLDLVVAAFAYYLYLYCNFSGFCDVAIGCAGLMGIKVAENFDNPLVARNVKEFWNRWHITLSQYMRDVVFSPLSKVLVRAWGVRRSSHAIAVTIMVVFLLVGVWHGVGWNYAAFGAVHGLALVGNHYYTLELKRRLGREKFVAYSDNHVIQVASICLTFVFVSASLFLFANNADAMSRILVALRKTS